MIIWTMINEMINEQWSIKYDQWNFFIRNEISSNEISPLRGMELQEKEAQKD